MRPVLLLPILLALASPAAAGAQTTFPVDATRILSGTPDGLAALPAPVAQASGASVSGDGRFAAFVSAADGLSGEDDDRRLGVFVKDRSTLATTLVSRATGVAGAPAATDCRSARISGDGTRVAFQCEGPLPGGPAVNRALYVRDLGAATTTLVSRRFGAAGDPVGAEQDDFAIDGDGSHVAFAATESDLDPFVTPVASGPFAAHVYRRAVATGINDLVSRRTTAGGTATGGTVTGVDLSADADTVAFSTTADLSTGAEDDANGTGDVYLRRLSTSQTDLASADDTGPAFTAGNGRSFAPALSADGDVVVWRSSATTLDARDTGPGINAYRHSFTSQATNLVDLQPGGGSAHDGRTDAVDVDADGGTVVTVTTSTGLFPGLGGEGRPVAVRHDGGTPTLLSRRDGAAGAAADGVSGVTVAADGATAVFGAIGATADADPAELQVVARIGATTTLVSRPPGAAPFTNGAAHELTVTGRSVSADGRYVAVSRRSPLGRVIVVRDTLTGATELASLADGPDGVPEPAFDDWALSADGRHVAYQATVGATDQILLRDLGAGTTTLVSRADGPAGAAGNAGSFSPSVSADGTRVAFGTDATNLGDGDVDTESDVHVRDLAARTTVLASRADGPAGANSDSSTQESLLSADGRRVVFTTTATNLADGDTDIEEDVHVRDLAAGRTILASRADGPAGTKYGAGGLGTAISADGNRVAFVADGRLLVRDLGAGATIETAATTLAGNGAAEVALDATGTVVAAVRRAGLGSPESQVLRAVVGATEAVLASRADGPEGATGVRGSSPSLTSGGGCTVFTDGADLAGGSADQLAAFVRVAAADCGRGTPPAGPSPLPPATTAPAVPSGPTATARDTTRPRISGAKLSRKRFRPGTGRRRGTVLTLRLSERARLALTVERRATVRRKGRRRVVWRRARVVRVAARPAGRVRVRLAGKGLRRGRHRLTIVATDAAGNRSARARLAFRVSA